jgi:hypothetical protein
VTVAGRRHVAYGSTISKMGVGGSGVDSGRYETELKLMRDDEWLPFSRATGRWSLQDIQKATDDQISFLDALNEVRIL